MPSNINHYVNIILKHFISANLYALLVVLAKLICQYTFQLCGNKSECLFGNFPIQTTFVGKLSRHFGRCDRAHCCYLHEILLCNPIQIVPFRAYLFKVLQ